MKFIDLFCGIGGFHQAIKKYNEGYNCVFACDKDAKCRETYKENYGIKPEGDIKKIDIDKIEDFDILCAGFPCQPFSNAGKKKSFSDKRGLLFDEIIKIAKEKKPKFMFLENVKHIKKVSNGKVFEYIINEVKNIGYYIDENETIFELSPHQLGIPQDRKRIIFVCIREDIYPKKLDQLIQKHELDIDIQKYYVKGEKCWDYQGLKDDIDITLKEKKIEEEAMELKKEKKKVKKKKVKKKIPKISKIPKMITLPEFTTEINYDNIFETDKSKWEKYRIDETLEKIFDIWDEMITVFDVGEKLSPTIMTNEFYNKYKNDPRNIDESNSVVEINNIDTDFKELALWRQDYITKNIPIYNKYKEQWDEWYNKYNEILKKSKLFYKLEWQVGKKKQNDSIYNYFIQMRQSGIRVKKTKYFPTLVAMVQTPIYGKQKRYLTPRECARLQSFPEDFIINKIDKIAYKQFGNSVNVDVIYTIIKATLDAFPNES